MRWMGCGDLLRKKRGAIAQGRMFCCATKVVPLRKAVVECDLMSSRKRSTHLLLRSAHHSGKKSALRQVEQGISRRSWQRCV